MSVTFGAPTGVGGRARSRGGGLTAALKTWWMAYLTRRNERAAIIELQAMSDRDLQDIGLTRAQIEGAVRGELYRQPLSYHF